MTMPACPGCQRPMKLSDEADLAACRCGLFVDLDGNFAPVPPFRQGEPWQDQPAGLRVTDQYIDLAKLWWEPIEIEPARLPAPEVWQRLCADAFEGSGLRYVGKPKHGARTLILDGGESLQRHRVYALAPLGQEADAAAAIVRFIRNKHGTGKLWAHGDVPIGPLRKRSQSGCRGTELSGVLHAVLGCYYYHEPIN